MTHSHSLDDADRAVAVSMDPELASRLRALYRLEVERAATDLYAAPIARPARGVSGRGIIASAFSTLAVAAVLLGALVLRPGVGPSPQVGGGATSAAPSSTSTTAATSEATALATQAQQDGIPGTIDGQPVLTGGAIADAVANATNDTPFLIGGWFPAGGAYTYCMAIIPGPASCTPYLLHLSKGSAESVFVYPSGATADIASYMATQAVVMRVHTHDARCQDMPNLDGCVNRMVLEEIVWLGPKS